MIRRRDYSETSSVSCTDESCYICEKIKRRDRSETSSVSCTSDKSCYICEKIKRAPKKKKKEVIYLQEDEDCCFPGSSSPTHLFFSEINLNTGLRFIGLGSSGPNFANGSYILCKSESINKMCVAVKDVSPISTPVNIQFTLVFASCDQFNDYSSGVIHTHLSTTIQIPPSENLQSRCAQIKISPPVCLKDCDLVGILVSPTNLEVSFQAAAAVCS